MPRKGSEPRVTRLEPLRPRGLRVRVHLDQGEPLEVSLEAVERLGLGVGDPLAANRRHHLLDADAESSIREAALGLLSHRARTRAELRRKLVGKGFRPARVDACLDRLAERGLLDDAAVASAFVRDRLRHRPRGRGRLAGELRAKGVPDAVARAAVDDTLEEEGLTEDALAHRVVSAWIRRQGLRPSWPWVPPRPPPTGSGPADACAAGWPGVGSPAGPWPQRWTRPWGSPEPDLSRDGRPCPTCGAPSPTLPAGLP